MNAAEALGRALAASGVDQVFGVVGSGNFEVTNAMVAGGARFVAARHEGGATTMADAYARCSDRVAAVTVHQGCGLTNAMTGIAEAAKSRTPLVVVAAEATSPHSNFHVDQTALAEAVGATPMSLRSGASASRVAAEAVAAARSRRTVLLNLPLDVQAEPATTAAPPPPAALPSPVVPSAEEVRRLAEALRSARRPVLVAGRGARSDAARVALERLAESSGALLATSAVAKGLFRDHPWSLDVSGGFASPLAAELIGGSDLVAGFGCTLNMWTTRHGRLIADDAVVAQIDDEPGQLGLHRDIDVGVVGDAALTADAVAEELGGPAVVGYRTDRVGAALVEHGSWLRTPTGDSGTADRIDPRVLTRALDAMVPEERVVAVDSGNFMGYPSMFLRVPDERGFCFTQAFQSIGLGLATAIGSALAQPGRLPVAALGDGGALMAASELETVARLGLPMLVVVYNDAAYGAEVHHFGPSGQSLESVRFPDTDIAAIARGHGYQAATVRHPDDLDAVASWVAGPRTSPMLVDAKVVTDEPSWWLEEAFRGH